MMANIIGLPTNYKHWLQKALQQTGLLTQLFLQWCCTLTRTHATYDMSLSIFFYLNCFGQLKK